MSNKCENCGQPVLETDVICWQCGWRLSTDTSPPSGRRTKGPGEGQLSISLSAVSVYAGLTVMVLAAVLLVLRSLSRQPLALTENGNSSTADWRIVSDQLQEYTLRLPDDWQWLDKRNLDHQADFATMSAQGNQFIAVIAPFGELETEWDLIGIATDDSPEAESGDQDFMIVAKNDSPDRLSAKQMAARLRVNDREYDVSNLILRSGSGVVPRVSTIIGAPITGQQLRCLHEYIEATGISYLIAGCSVEARFPLQAKGLQLILDSFELGKP